jgi:beta-glucanase (GH16 family)
MTIKATQLSRLAAAISVTTLFGCGGGATTSTDINVVEPSAPVSDWQLVWSDEFDGSSIDDDKWTHEINCAGGGNNEAQCYTDDGTNSFVDDGVLNIVALPAEEGAQKPYTSARLNTRYKGDFKYGRIEMRAKMPSGQGSWPAFWMTGIQKHIFTARSIMVKSGQTTTVQVKPTRYLMTLTQQTISTPTR